MADRSLLSHRGLTAQKRLSYFSPKSVQRMGSTSLDDSLARFDELAGSLSAYLSNHYNEADTRVKFIDVMLTQVLGWDEHIHIRREENCKDDEQKRCVDYVLSLQEPILVVEAKRILKDFEIPSKIDLVHYSLRGVITLWANAWDAIVQAQKYCVNKGARYALVTNGRQWIAFKAISERGSWLDGKALVLSSPDVVRKHFPLFYECLSRETISEDKLTELAFPREGPATRRKARSAITVSNSGYRNELYSVLDSAFRQILLDVPISDPNFLRECYCSSADAMKYSGQLNAAVVDPSPIFRSPVAEIRPGHRKDAFSQTLEQSPASVQSPSPLFVVMGGQGVGKTTFLHWYFDEQMPEEAKNRTIVVYCDFRTIECTTDELHARTLRLVIEGILSQTPQYTSEFSQLYEIFRARVDRELKGTLRPYAADPVERDKRISDLLARFQDYGSDHLKALVSYLRAKPGKQTVIILDNMDQKSPELQDNLYQIGHEFVYGCSATVVVAIRESTFRRMTRLPTFNAFASIEFHLKAQRIDLILEKRLNYLASRLSASKICITTQDGKSLEVADFDRFLGLLRRSLLDSQSDQRILECVTAISNGDMRKQLDMIYSFLVSGQTKIADYFWDYARGQSSCIPFHEFIHSLLHEDRKFFDEGAGDWFINVFQPAPQANASSLTALRLLHYLRAGLGHNGDLRPTDFVQIDQLEEAFAPYGVGKSELSFHVSRLAEFGLLATESGEQQQLFGDTSYALTKSGIYYLDQLYWEFAYFSAMACDTSISKQSIVDPITSILSSNLAGPKIPLHARCKMAELFAGYLDKIEQVELRGAISRHPVLAGVRFVPRMIAQLRSVPCG
ncbi:MAG: hypothetical protein NTU94_09000 [Planctomycetota bacterium]|nr:hypothetical protein [Planctomycetota bacterium]